MSDDPHCLTELVSCLEAASAEGCRTSGCPAASLSLADLHRRCVGLEDERRRLAVEMAERWSGGSVECRRLMDPERTVIREIGLMLDRMQAVACVSA